MEQVLPTSGSDHARIAEQRRRLRLLERSWEQDARARMTARLGSVRSAALGPPDLSANPARAIWVQSAVLLDRPPALVHPEDEDGRAAALLGAAAREAHLWPTLARVQRRTLALNEMVAHVDVSPDGRLLVRQVTPDLTDGEEDPDDPTQAAVVTELRRRSVDGRLVWTRETTDPASLTVQVTRCDSGVELDEYTLAGDEYPYRWSDGTPYQPLVYAHTSATGTLYSPWEQGELVEGTLEAACLWSFWGHCVRDAGWPQRYAVGVQVAGASQVGTAGAERSHVVTDPATVLLLVPTGIAEGITPQVGQWAAGADPEALARSIIAYESRLPIFAGASPADFTRTSGDPRSGYALAISREGQRDAARRHEPLFGAFVGLVLDRCAAALNQWSRAAGAPLDLPERGWAPRFTALPPSLDERAALREDVLARLDRGLISRVAAYARLNEITEAEARAQLEAIDREAEPQEGEDG